MTGQTGLPNMAMLRKRQRNESWHPHSTCDTLAEVAGVGVAEGLLSAWQKVSCEWDTLTLLHSLTHTHTHTITVTIASGS